MLLLLLSTWLFALEMYFQYAVCNILCAKPSVQCAVCRVLYVLIRSTHALCSDQLWNGETHTLWLQCCCPLLPTWLCATCIVQCVLTECTPCTEFNVHIVQSPVCNVQHAMYCTHALCSDQLWKVHCLCSAAASAAHLTRPRAYLPRQPPVLQKTSEKRPEGKSRGGEVLAGERLTSPSIFFYFWKRWEGVGSLMTNNSRRHSK